MIKKIFAIVFILTSVAISQNNDYSNYRSFHIAGGFQAGLSNGASGQLNILFSGFADNFPFSAKIAAGISFLDAGDPMAARRIFINNNTNGVPDKDGKTYNFSLDFLYRKSFLGLKRNYFYLGPRHTMFTGTFNYIGGNEDFEVTSNQWGVGFGIENYFKIIPAIDLVLNLGYDYYISETLYGHDTFYSPDGQDVNPREDYNFDDADNAINQPKHQLKILIGFSYNIK
ncbi:MAG: hypothetical protein GY936_20355 [Ignavibacteriae bacterium]|nr:hypothetical protein [Ignavibacteriota bacterium]